MSTAGDAQARAVGLAGDGDGPATGLDALQPLLQRLLSQFVHFPALLGERASQAHFERFAAPRLKVLQLLALAPQSRGQVRRALAGQPYLYNTAMWPADAAPAGYFDAKGALAPEEVLRSQAMCWLLQLQAGEDAGPAGGRRMLRAALWMLRQHGFAAAQRYLLDLQRAGYDFDGQSTTVALLALMHVRRRVAGDEDIVDALLDPQAVARDGWLVPDLRPVEALPQEPCRETFDDLGLVVQWAESEIDRVMQAADYDAWLLGQFQLRAAMNTARSVLEAYGMWDDLAIAASATRIEEVRADAFAFMQSGRLAQMDGQFVYGADFNLAYTMAFILSAQTPDWRHRMQQERALVPEVLVPQLVGEHGVLLPQAQQLPACWRELSPAKAALYAACVLQDELLPLCRRKRHTMEEATLLARAAFEARGIDETGPRRAWLVQAYAGTEVEVREAKALLEASGTAGDALKDELRALRADMATAELRQTLGQAEALHPDGAGQGAQLLALWHRHAAHYPYFDPGLYEQAIALDQLGRGREALPLLFDAIALRPEEPLRWQSLGVVLRHLGHIEEALPCLLVAHAFGQGVRPQAPPDGPA